MLMLNRTLLSNLGNKVNISLPAISNILFAFSTRRLVPTATKQGKWIKTSGGTNPDIYFKSNGMYDVNKDESNITYTNYLYNQVSQYRYASQATFAKCPSIASGSVVYKGFKSDGIDDYLTISSVELPDSVFNASYSINMWINLPTNAATRYITSHTDATTGHHRFLRAAGSIFYRYYTNTSVLIGTIPDNTWAMITVVKSGTGNGAVLTGYINGELTVTSSPCNVVTGSTVVLTTICGSASLGAESIQNDILMYDKALSQELITQIYNQTRNYYV